MIGFLSASSQVHMSCCAQDKFAPPRDAGLGTQSPEFREKDALEGASHGFRVSGGFIGFMEFIGFRV